LGGRRTNLRRWATPFPTSRPVFDRGLRVGERGHFPKTTTEDRALRGSSLVGCNLRIEMSYVVVDLDIQRTASIPLGNPEPPGKSSAQAQALDQGSVPFDVSLGHVVEQPSALTD
jgi:hypothetical protein